VEDADGLDHLAQDSVEDEVVAGDEVPEVVRDVRLGRAEEGVVGEELHPLLKRVEEPVGGRGVVVSDVVPDGGFWPKPVESTTGAVTTGSGE
jgi:hypothetical protein